jgi:hypothetical protein
VLYQKHFLEHEFPACIVSDNGPAFASELIGKLDKLSNIRHLFTTPYHPQSNGKIERKHRDLKAGLKIYVDEHHTNWDKKLLSLTYALRTTPDETSVYTPFYLWHGRHPVTPLDILSGAFDKEPTSQELVLTAMQSQLEAARVAEQLKTQRDAKWLSKAPEETKLPTLWETGQMVLVKRPQRQEGLSTKLLYGWVGPFTVRKMVTPVNYSVDLGNGRSQTYHVSRLHPYHPTTYPLGKDIEVIDLFDYTAVSEADDFEMGAPLLPVEPYQIGQLLLFDQGRDARIGRIEMLDPDSDILEMHTYDTMDLDFTQGSDDQTNWEKGLYPLYLNNQNGLKACKSRDAAGMQPVIIRIHYTDVLDVPFTLSKDRLKKAQLKILHRWHSGNYADVSAPLWN